MQVSDSKQNYKKYKSDVEIADWSNNFIYQFYENTRIEPSQLSCIDFCCNITIYTLAHYIKIKLMNILQNLLL